MSTSSADDLAYSALADICTLTSAENIRIVGGQMTNLLLTAFPTERAIPRRTADADAALDMELAMTGYAHELLTNFGYTAQDGNSYVRDGQQIDLLVPSWTGRFEQEEIAGRGFDAAPGIGLALAGEPISIQASVTLTGGEVLDFVARTPTVEKAIVLKAYAYKHRHAMRDLVDLHNLMWIVETREKHSIGGWRLDEAVRGARLDAQRVLRQIANDLHIGQKGQQLEVDTQVLIALIRRLVFMSGSN